MSVNPGNTPGRRRGRGGRARQPRPLPIFEYDDEAKGPQIGRAAASAAAPALPVPAHDGMVVDSAGVPRRRTSVKLFEDDDSTVGAGKGAGEVGAGARGASGVSSVPSLMVPSPYDVPSVGQMLGPVPPPAPPRAPPRDESSSSGGSGSGSGSSSPRAKRLSEVIGFVVSWGRCVARCSRVRVSSGRIVFACYLRHLTTSRLHAFPLFPPPPHPAACSPRSRKSRTCTAAGARRG